MSSRRALCVWVEFGRHFERVGVCFGAVLCAGVPVCESDVAQCACIYTRSYVEVSVFDRLVFFLRNVDFCDAIRFLKTIKVI